MIAQPPYHYYIKMNSNNIFLPLFHIHRVITAPQMFSYDPPMIDRILVDPEVGAVTSGNTVITVVGNNFGIDVSSIVIGEKECTLIDDIRGNNSNHTHSECLLSEGAGADLDVTITVAGQSGTLESSFSYIAPTLSRIEPMMLPTEGKLFRFSGVRLLVLLEAPPPPPPLVNLVEVQSLTNGFRCRR